jgi:hypothetical protein
MTATVTIDRPTVAKPVPRRRSGKPATVNNDHYRPRGPKCACEISPWRGWPIPGLSRRSETWPSHQPGSGGHFLRHGGRRADLANDVERLLGGCTSPLRSGIGATRGLTFGQEALPALCFNSRRCVGWEARMSARAEDYPARPVTVIVPFAAGGPADITGRIVADIFAHHLGQRFVVENVANRL